ncbi:hypothetical protein [Microbacterium sp.]|uniref:hypothetical protein n=1 Tax=Microbacterium sp. TaxID=51671 RepID=UPI003C77FD81
MTAPVVSSTPVLRTTLLWSAVATGILAVAGALIGFAVADWSGLWSALVAIVLAAVFLGLTGASILIANRWFDDPLYVPIFFGAVMGGWILKFVIFIAVLLMLRGQSWLHPTVFFIALVASIVASLVIDVVVMLRMRVPHASDVTLPTLADVVDEARAPLPPRGGDAEAGAAGGDTAADTTTPGA